MPLTANELLRESAERYPDRPALLAPNRVPICYGQLWKHVQQIASTLGNLGLGPTDRVAVVLPNGPEMASAILSVTAVAVCAPLNPDFRVLEFRNYLSDLGPSLLLIQAGLDSPAAAVAHAHGVRVIQVLPQLDAPAGIFSLRDVQANGTFTRVSRQNDEVCLLLHTSGTTSRHKVVPLTQANLSNSARNIETSLGLRVEDRCLNIMPMYHVHGLVGALLSSIAAGSSVVCTAGLDSTQFFDWVKEFEPTWFTAVPTMLQAILARAEREDGRHSRRSRLRFIRSCSSALPAKLMSKLEHQFQVPVVEAYGMTEASHQISINPLPPGIRKAGSVGRPVGCDVAVLNEAGGTVPAGQTGAIVVRGPNVIRAYQDDCESSQSFTGGWLHTGDEGKFDSDGYLFLTGRTKEFINRGGEKIAPREIEDALLEHPAVAEAMAFALPDDRLGEDVAVAVVPHEPVNWRDSTALQTELRDFVASKFVHFKVPRRILLLEEIPKGSTGKPQRVGMSAKLGITESGRAMVEPYVAPQSELQMQIVRIWEKVLDTRPVGIRSDFFKLGGDSLMAVRMMTEIEASSGLRLPLSTLLPTATVENVASAMLLAQKDGGRPILAIQPSGSKPPLFFFHGQWQGGGLYCGELSRTLGTDQPFFAVLPHGFDGEPAPKTIQAMVIDRLPDLLAASPAGPIRLGGYCNGALVAYEMARELTKLGRKVELVVLIEIHAPNTPFRGMSNALRLACSALSLDREIEAEWFLRLRNLKRGTSRGSPLRAFVRFVRRRLRKLQSQAFNPVGGPSKAGLNAAASASAHADPYSAINSYVPGPYDGAVALLRTREIGSRTANFCPLDDPSAGWSAVAPKLHVYWLPGTHETIVRGLVDGLAGQLVRSLEDIASCYVTESQRPDEDAKPTVPADSSAPIRP